MHTQPHAPAVTEILQFLPSCTSDQPYSLALILPPPPPSLNPSLPWNWWTVLSRSAAFCAIFIWRKKLISHSMNFHNLCSAVIGKWWATGLTGKHTHAHTRIPTNLLSKLQARSLFCTNGIWQWFMKKRSHTTPRYIQQHKARLLAQTWAQREVTAPSTKPHWQRCTLWLEVNTAFMQPTKWMHLLSISCFDEFHGYESTCFRTQRLLNDSSGNCVGLGWNKSDFPSVTLSPSLYASQSRFIMHYYCGIVSVVNLERPDTPCSSAWVCPLQCQAFLLSFCVGMLDPPCRCYQLQPRWGHHIPSDLLQVLRTQGSDLAGNLQHFLFHSWFWNTHMQSLQEEKRFLREYFFFLLSSDHRAFSAVDCKIHSGCWFVATRVLGGTKQTAQLTGNCQQAQKKRRKRYSKWDRQMRDRWKGKSFLVSC